MELRNVVVLAVRNEGAQTASRRVVLSVARRQGDRPAGMGARRPLAHLPAVRIGHDGRTRTPGGQLGQGHAPLEGTSLLPVYVGGRPRVQLVRAAGTEPGTQVG